MTTPAPSGGPSPLRVGGLALLGVGAVAAVIGIGTLVTGGGDGSNSAAPAPTSSAAAPVSPTAVAPPSADVPVPSFGPTPTNAIAAPGTDGSGSAGSGGSGSGGSGSGGSASGTGGGSGSAGSGGGSGASVVKSPVRVYNNSTITGLAARAADDFRSEGWTVTAVSNYPSGKLITSTVYYRAGTAEQSGAEAMGKEFGLRVEPRFPGLDDASPGIIVIVTNDYQKRG